MKKTKHKKLKLDSVRASLPESLISIETEEGQNILKNAILCPSTKNLSETQMHPAYCGLASSSVILRSFNFNNVKQTNILDPLLTHTPLNWFDTFGIGILDLRCIPNLWKYHITKFLIYDGISIQGICLLLNQHNLHTKPILYPQSSLPEFRKLIRMYQTQFKNTIINVLTSRCFRSKRKWSF